MATFKGREGSVSVGTVPAGGVAVGELRSFELTISANTTDASRMGDTWTREESTQNKWSASMELFWDSADAGQDLLLIGERVTLNLFPRGNTGAATDVVYTGVATITEIGHKQAHDGLVERTISVSGYGALTEGTM
jgi:hypothetical protein